MISRFRTYRSVLTSADPSTELPSMGYDRRRTSRYSFFIPRIEYRLFKKRKCAQSQMTMFSTLPSKERSMIVKLVSPSDSIEFDLKSLY